MLRDFAAKMRAINAECYRRGTSVVFEANIVFPGTREPE
jgi:hypothetical protein